MNRLPIALMLAVLIVLAAPAQDSAPVPSAPKTAVVNDKFSGTVTELSSESVTVLRTAIAKPGVTRKFSLDSGTKVEGTLKVKSRVTVQYDGEAGAYHAVHIIVR